MDNLLILGAGGNSKVIAETYMSCINHCNIKYLDDNYINIENNSNEIIGPLSKIFEIEIKNKFSRAIISISDPKVRMYWLDILERENYNIKPIIHKNCFISKTAKIDNGSVIYAKACIQTEVKIGRGVFINTNSCIEHNSIIDSGVHICPGSNIGGNVNIGSCSWIGIGSSIIQNIKIGENVMIGAGTVVTKNIPKNSLAVGSPAKVIKNN